MWKVWFCILKCKVLLTGFGFKRLSVADTVYFRWEESILPGMRSLGSYSPGNRAQNELGASLGFKRWEAGAFLAQPEEVGTEECSVVKGVGAEVGCVGSPPPPGSSNKQMWKWNCYRGQLAFWLEAEGIMAHLCWQVRPGRLVHSLHNERQAELTGVGPRNCDVLGVCLWFHNSWPSDRANEDTWTTVWITRIKLKSSVSRLSPSEAVLASEFESEWLTLLSWAWLLGELLGRSRGPGPWQALCFL